MTSRAGTSSTPPASTTSPLVSHLDNGSLPMLQLRSAYRQELANLLILAPARTALVIERSLQGPLGLIADPEYLKQLGIDTMYYLTTDDIPPPSTISHFLYLVHPSVVSVRMLSRQILSHRSSHSSFTYSILFTPRTTRVAERELEVQGVKGDIQSIQSFAYDLIPLEWDVLSMEHPLSFKETMLDGDPSSLYHVARSLMRLQAMFGLFRTIRGKGSQAMKVCTLMQRMRKEMPSVFKDTTVLPSSGPFEFPLHADIDELLLLDRSTDLITPMLTQLTYEGLVDEMFGIKFSTIDVDASILGGDNKANASTSSSTSSSSSSSTTSGPKKKLLLTSTDTVFEEMRDLSFRSIGPLLQRKLTAVNATFEARHDAMSVAELKRYMGKFKTAHTERQWLTVHVNLADQIAPTTTKSKLFDRRLEVERAMLSGEGSVEEVEEYVEAAIAKQAPLFVVLRLLALMSLTSGIRQRKFDSLKRDLVQTYGYHTLFIINNMERLGLLSANRRRYDALRKVMRLWSEGGGKDSIGYAYEGYAPLSVRLIEMGSVTVGGWKKMDEIMSMIPGQPFEVKQERKPAQQQQQHAHAASSAAAAAGGGGGGGASASASASAGVGVVEEKPLVLVFFIGGVTFAEISALRWLSARDGHPKEYMVATTKIINGTNLLESLDERPEAAP